MFEVIVATVLGVYDSQMEVEGVVLTGGASRRMGRDKSKLTVDGEPLSTRLARDLRSHCGRVTVLGKEPIEGYEFVADEEEYAGPLIALSCFQPRAEAVFVTSCDLPRFDGRLVGLFGDLLRDQDAVLPMNEGRLQPLCGLYRAKAWNDLQATVDAGGKSLMAWLDRLTVQAVDSEEIAHKGIDPRSICGANTPEEWERLLSD